MREINLKDEYVDDLFTAILTLRDLDECYAFFEDLGTVNEIKSFAQRFGVAKLLREGKTYVEITKATGASTATISRVSRCLNYGRDGLDLAFGRMNDKEKE